MGIWLKINTKAHDFIDKSYWKNNYDMVKAMLPDSTIFVYEDHRGIHVFKMLYLAMNDITEKWIGRPRDWTRILEQNFEIHKTLLTIVIGVILFFNRQVLSIISRF